MKKPNEMTEAEYAEWLYAHRDELNVSEPVEVEVSANLASVVSVRFKRGELERIEKAAQAVGMPFTAYIRESALAASGSQISLASDGTLKSCISSPTTCLPRSAKKPSPNQPNTSVRQLVLPKPQQMPLQRSLRGANTTS